MHWAEIREAGSFWGLRLLVVIYKVAGAPVLRLILYPLVTYFFLSNRTARNASLEYLGQLASFDPTIGIKPSLATSYRHFLSFAASLLDRVGAWMGRMQLDDLMLSGHDELIAAAENRTGALLFGAHLGSLEVSRALSRLRPNIRLNVLIHTLNAAKFNRVLRAVSPSAQLELIEVTQINPAVAIRLQRKLARGEFIVITADRIPVGSGRVSRVSFLGKQASFPQGPVLLAGLLKCPVFTLFCIKEPGGYRLHCEAFAQRITLNRDGRGRAIDAVVQRFAARLERYCVAAPLQWFNFYPFWADAPVQGDADDARAAS